MAFLVEDGTGLSAANSYLAVDDFKVYHTDRGNDFSSFSDESIETALARATDYIDRKYLYVGFRTHQRRQALEWPRISAYDPEGHLVDSASVPREIEDACAELGFVALTQVLMPNLDFDASGGYVTELTNMVGSVRSTVKYSTLQGRKAYPTYTAADALLRRLARFEKQLVRAS